MHITELSAIKEKSRTLYICHRELKNQARKDLTNLNPFVSYITAPSNRHWPQSLCLPMFLITASQKFDTSFVKKNQSTWQPSIKIMWHDRQKSHPQSGNMRAYLNIHGFEENLLIVNSSINTAFFQNSGMIKDWMTVIICQRQKKLCIHPRGNMESASQNSRNSSHTLDQRRQAFPIDAPVIQGRYLYACHASSWCQPANLLNLLVTVLTLVSAETPFSHFSYTCQVNWVGEGFQHLSNSIFYLKRSLWK